MSRAWYLVTAVVLFSSVAVAQVPEFNVIPDDVDRNLSAFNRQELEFSFTNQDSSRDIFNVTLDNTSYLSWEQNRFDLNASQTRTVNASFFARNITTFRDVLESDYKYNGSDNDFSGPNISLEISTFYEQTSVSTSVFDSEFELGFGETDSSVVEIVNDGEETAYNVSLQGDDIGFETESSFDLRPGEDRLVRFNISIPRPEDDPTDATNQTYTRDIVVSGSNFNTSRVETSVFVPFNEFDSEQQQRSLVDQILQNRERLVEFCGQEENQDSILCGNQIVKFRNNTEVEFRTPRANISLTNEEILALKQLANTTTKKYNEILNRVRLQQNTFRSELDETRSNFSLSLAQVENDTERNRQRIEELQRRIDRYGERQTQEARNRTFWMRLTFLLVFLYLVARGVLWLYRNWNELTNDPRWS